MLSPVTLFTDPSTLHVHPHLTMSMSNTQQQEEDTDPFLELEPQTLYHHEHDDTTHRHGSGHSHNTRGHVVNVNNIDPSLQAGDASQGRTNRLTDFASHILGSQDGDQIDHAHDHDHDHDHDHGQEHEHEHDIDEHGRHELSFTGEGGVLESSNHGFHVMDHDHNHGHGHEEEEVDEGEFEPHLEEEGDGEGDFVGETPGPQVLLTGGSGGARVGRKRGAYGKRKRAGQGDDEVVIKKQNHVSHVPITLLCFTVLVLSRPNPLSYPPRISYTFMLPSHQIPNSFVASRCEHLHVKC